MRLAFRSPDHKVKGGLGCRFDKGCERLTPADAVSDWTLWVLAELGCEGTPRQLCVTRREVPLCHARAVLPLSGHAGGKGKMPRPKLSSCQKRCEKHSRELQVHGAHRGMLITYRDSELREASLHGLPVTCPVKTWAGARCALIP